MILLLKHEKSLPTYYWVLQVIILDRLVLFLSNMAALFHHVKQHYHIVLLFIILCVCVFVYVVIVLFFVVLNYLLFLGNLLT